MERLLRNGMGKKGGGGWGGVSRMVEMCLMTVILQHGQITIKKIKVNLDICASNQSSSASWFTSITRPLLMWLCCLRPSWRRLMPAIDFLFLGVLLFFVPADG